MKKLILMTGRLDHLEAVNETRQGVDIRWFEFLSLADVIPVVLPLGVPLQAYLERFPVDGFLLTGGNDLSSLTTCSLSKLRDEHEIQIIEYAVAHRLPLIGVCRGAQLISEKFGSSLKPVYGHVCTEHTLIHTQNSKVYNIIKNIDIANSYHNFIIHNVLSSINVVSTTKEGHIEAIEHAHHPILGIMWHPERREFFLEAEITLFKDFFSKTQELI